MLQKIVSEMPQEEASYHIKRCVDSGLWVPGGNDGASGEDKNGDAEISDDGEEVYEECLDVTENTETAETDKDKPKQVTTDELD